MRSKSLTPEDEQLLLAVHCDNLKALLCVHQGASFHHHGTLASKSAISRWMATRFPHKMTFRKANKVVCTMQPEIKPAVVAIP